MSLPSKYAPEGLSSSDQKKVITVGQNRPKGPMDYTIKTIEDRIDEAVKHSPLHINNGNDTQYEDDIEMIPMDDYNEVEVISDFVRANRNNSDILYDDSMDIEVDRETTNTYREGNTSFLVVDTNFTLSHLNIINNLQELARKYGLVIIIPITVMKELDGLKNSSRIAKNESSETISDQSVGHLARWANDWIYSALAKNDTAVRGQKMRQRLDKSTIKDDAILDCCLYFKENFTNSLVVLLSNDKNLCLKSLANDILTVSYRKQMSADIIAETIYTENLRRFGKINIESVDSVHTDNLVQQRPTVTDEDQYKITGSFDQISRTIFQEVQALALSITHRCMENNYGDDLDLIRNYDRDTVTTLMHCSQIIIRFWLPVFSNYFKGNMSRNVPFIEVDDGKKSTKQPKLVDIPLEVRELNDFVDFWSDILTILSLEVMNEQQNIALEVLTKRWKQSASSLAH